MRVEMQEAKAIDRLTDGDLRTTRQDLRLPIQHDEEGIVARRDGKINRLVLGEIDVKTTLSIGKGHLKQCCNQTTC